jgi:hypothetical protein
LFQQHDAADHGAQEKRQHSNQQQVGTKRMSSIQINTMVMSKPMAITYHMMLGTPASTL